MSSKKGFWTHMQEIMPPPPSDWYTAIHTTLSRIIFLLKSNDFEEANENLVKKALLETPDPSFSWKVVEVIVNGVSELRFIPKHNTP